MRAELGLLPPVCQQQQGVEYAALWSYFFTGFAQPSKTQATACYIHASMFS